MNIIINNQPLQLTSKSILSLQGSYFAGERTAFVTCQSLKYFYFGLFSQNSQTKRLIFSEYLTTYIHLNPSLGSPKHALKQTYKSKLTIPYLIYCETDSSCTTVHCTFASNNGCCKYLCKKYITKMPSILKVQHHLNISALAL